MSKERGFYQWRPHPWHGLEVGPNPPELVHAYIEITPSDSIKYEIDKETGYLRVDRPQRFSSQPPALYGFVPRTFCGNRVRDLTPESECGDGDPLDICVVSERPIMRAEVILNVRVVGGLQTIDGGEADDKIIAVLANDNVWGQVNHISELPAATIERIRHYFETYKLLPGEPSPVQVRKTYDKSHAMTVVRAAMADYDEAYSSAVR